MLSFSAHKITAVNVSPAREYDHSDRSETFFSRDVVIKIDGSEYTAGLFAADRDSLILPVEREAEHLRAVNAELLAALADALAALDNATAVTDSEQAIFDEAIQQGRASLAKARGEA